MKNVLVTGASGFIGSFLVEEGLRNGYTVYAGIRKSSSKRYLTDPAIQFIEFDFSSRSKIVSTLNQCKKEGIRFDYIIHNAGVTKVRNKDEFHRVNCQYTIHFIEALRETEMVPEKFIYISSLAAYGPGDPVSGAPVRLSDAPKPIELYGKSKLEAEKYIMAQADFPWLIFRPTGVYGPRETDYFVFFQTISRGLEPYIGFKQQILTFIYVRDLVRVIFTAISGSIIRKAWFVSDGKEYTSEEFADITKKVLQRKTFRFTVPLFLVKTIATAGEAIAGLWGGMPTLNTDKYNVLSSTNWRCETEPLTRDFNFRADYDLQKGVEEAISWYKKERWL